MKLGTIFNVTTYPIILLQRYFEVQLTTQGSEFEPLLGQLIKQFSFEKFGVLVFLSIRGYWQNWTLRSIKIVRGLVNNVFPIIWMIIIPCSECGMLWGLIFLILKWKKEKNIRFLPITFMNTPDIFLIIFFRVVHIKTVYNRTINLLLIWTLVLYLYIFIIDISAPTC